jgi:ribosomal protein S18 acetylase RimI-like enzyme
MPTKVTTTFLEMTSPSELRRSPRHRHDLVLTQATIPCPELNRFLYTAVGGEWYWIDRLGWTYDRWMKYLDRPELETWVGTIGGTPAGYFELEHLPATGVELAYFGVMPRFIGQGVGGTLLTAAIERAWARQPQRVWLHTCTLDHPSALANYQARGFRVYKEEAACNDLPAQTPGPWPGAR